MIENELTQEEKNAIYAKQISEGIFGAISLGTNIILITLSLPVILFALLLLVII